ncbi:allergen Tha p 1-like [Aphidius gifuensis]
MKIAILFLAVMVAVVTAKPANQYTNKYDDINLDEILGNKRILNNYIKCLLEQGSCTPEGTELKMRLPDALETGCSKCNEKQKAGAKKMIEHLIKNDRDKWDKLMEKYDPESKYRTKFEDELKTLSVSA